MSTLIRRRFAHATVNWAAAAVTAGVAEALAIIIIVAIFLAVVGLASLLAGETPVLELDLWRLQPGAAAVPLPAKT